VFEDREIKELISIEGFDKAFMNNLATSVSYEEAYEKVEAKYKSMFGKRRYTNYHCYRNSRRRRLMKR